MDVLNTVIPEPDTRRAAAAIDLIAIALARALSSPAVAPGAEVSVYAHVEHTLAVGPR